MKHIALVLCLTACATTWIIGNDSWFRQNPHGKQTLEQRASFDLGCPKESLQFQQIGTDWKTVGVAGCDKKSTYVYDDYHHVWVLNAATQAASR